MPLSVKASEKLSKFGFKDEEYEELEYSVFSRTGFPAPFNKYRLYWTTTNAAIEEPYYFVLDHLKQTWGFHKFDKIIDLTGASEQSVLFGINQQRLGLQQEKVSQFLATTGKMIKELFQLVREIRILDERLSYYKKIYSNKSGAKSADITLKGIWIDLVEGGSKNPSSVYGMATQLGFMTLPDLFFDTFVLKSEDVDKAVDKLEFNRKVKEVLRRKLMTYVTWREHTYKELQVRRTFTIKYLRQHYNSIKMYIEWIKPYLRNIKRMQLNDKLMNKADLVSAFESTAIEVEFLAIKVGDKGGKVGNYFPCVLATFEYSTQPSFSYHGEGYQRAPIHVGEVKIKLRSYAWTEEDIENYKKYRNEEAFDVLTSIDSSLKSAMDALGNELKKYVEEHEGTIPENKAGASPNKVNSSEGILDPFISVFKGFGEMFGSLSPVSLPQGGSKTKTDPYKDKANKNAAGAVAAGVIWQTYKNFKKAHKPAFMAW